MTSSPSLITAPSLPPAGERSAIWRAARHPGHAGWLGSHENWGIFKCHLWGELLRHSQREDYGAYAPCSAGPACRSRARQELSDNVGAEARRAIDNRPRLTRSSRSARQAASLSPPMFLTASSTFWPSSRTPSATRSEIDVAFNVAFLSSRTRPIVPSKNPSDDQLVLQGARVPGIPIALHLVPNSATVSFPTAPPNKAASARRTRRVLVPAR